MPNRKRHALDRRAQPGQGHEVAGVAIARHDLGGHHFRMQAQALSARISISGPAGVGSTAPASLPTEISSAPAQGRVARG